MDQLKDSLRVFVVPTEILDAELDIYEKMVYMVLRSYANGQDDTAFPSYQTIATKGSMSKRKAMDSVKKLVELGLVEKEERKKVSKKNGISQTSNLYTIHRPAEIQKKEVVHSMHHPSAQHAPGVVHDMHQGSAQHAPENNYLKELDLKELNKSVCSEEQGIFSLLESRSDIDPHTHKQLVSLLNAIKKKDTFQYSIFRDTLNKMDFDIQDMNYFKRALTNNLKDGYVRPVKDHAAGSTRKELLPDWFDENETKRGVGAPKKEVDQEAKKKEIEKMLNRLRA